MKIRLFLIGLLAGLWGIGAVCAQTTYDPKKGEFEAFYHNAQKGNALAQFFTGLCYYNGSGVKKDYVEAAKWFRKAAEQGDAGGQVELGKCYYNGYGVKCDSDEAAKWFRKAAEQGHPEGQTKLALCIYRRTSDKKILYRSFHMGQKGG